MGTELISEPFERPEPPLSPRTGEYWRAGSEGVLRIARCQSCGLYLHPPRPVCARCRALDVRFEQVSGRGTVWSWTVNRYQWLPSMPPPYIVASVELVEQQGLRLLTNLVDIDEHDVRIGMVVTVCFAQAGEAFIPVFRAAGHDATA